MSGVTTTVEEQAIRFLAKRDRTTAQLKAFLERKGAAEPQVVTLLQRFQQLGYLNDEAYALHWSQSRLDRYPMGQQRLVEEVCAQGIERSQAERMVARLYVGESELDYARTVLRRQMPRMTNGQEKKAVALLRRRGFEEDVIQQVVFLPEEERAGCHISVAE